MEHFTAGLIAWLKAKGPDVIYAAIILFAGRWVAKWLGSITAKMIKKAKGDETVSRFFASLVNIAILTFVIIAALSRLGIAVSSFVAVLAAAGFAVIVEEINIFNTLLKSPDNRKIVVPNSKITGDNIVNYSAKETRRLDLVFGISYTDNIKTAKDIVKKIVDGDSRVLSDPACTIGVLELAESSVNLAVRPWVKTQDYWNVYFDLNEKIKIAFDENGITIPFPQTDVHIHQGASAFKVDGTGLKEVTQ